MQTFLTGFSKLISLPRDLEVLWYNLYFYRSVRSMKEGMFFSHALRNFESEGMRYNNTKITSRSYVFAERILVQVETKEIIIGGLHDKQASVLLREHIYSCHAFTNLWIRVELLPFSGKQVVEIAGEFDVTWDRICRYGITLCLTEGNGMKLFGFPCSFCMFLL